MTDRIECPNCGGGVDVEQGLDLDVSVFDPPRWLVARCVGRPFRGVWAEPHDVSPPCGWFRWEHQVTRPSIPLRRVVPPDHPAFDLNRAYYSQPAWTPGQSWEWDDLTPEQQDHVARVAEYVRATEEAGFVWPDEVAWAQEEPS